MSDSLKTQYSLYIRKLIIFSLLLGLAGYVIVFTVMGLRLTLTLFLVEFAFFFTLSALVHYILLKASQKRPQQFINTFTGITGAKLFLLVSILMIYLGIDKSSYRMEAVMVFFCLYLFYSGFEVVQLFRNLRKTSQQ